MEPTMEFLQNGTGRRRNRRWPDEVKARIVAETLLPGVSVSSVARRHGITANHISSWRGRAKRGDLILPAPETAMEFASLVLGSSSQPSVSEPLASCRKHSPRAVWPLIGSIVYRVSLWTHTSTPPAFKLYRSVTA